MIGRGYKDRVDENNGYEKDERRTLRSIKKKESEQDGRRN